MTARLDAERSMLEQEPTWADGNQQWLVAAIARLRARLESHSREAAEGLRQVADVTTNNALPDRLTPALLHCARLFGLSPFERELLLLIAGMELDQGLRAAVAALTGGSSPTVSFSLALRALTQPHWDVISPHAPLRYWEIIELEESSASFSLSRAPIRIDERILHYVTGLAADDPVLTGVARRVDTAEQVEEEIDVALAERVAVAFTRADEVTTVIVNSERQDVGGLRHLGLGVVRRVGGSALWVLSSDLPNDPAELARLAKRIDREGMLANALPVLLLDTPAAETAALSLASRMGGPLLWLGPVLPGLRAPEHMRRVLRFDLPAPDAGRTSTALIARCRSFLSRGQAEQHALPRIIDALELAAAQFHVGADGVHDIVERLEALPPDEREGAVWCAAREAARGGLDTLAHRVVSTVTLADVVLPPSQLATIKDITRQLRNRERVYRDWGFASRHPRSQGIAALFAGESGTGKTLAAEAIANEVELDLYRVDLATVVSKYIGETEKNLKRLFDAAESSGAVLLFDEADSLFGKRSEIKDSHDRYANIEIAYLLQRIESYRGLAILTTNMKSALDRAFLRRIRFVVHFPFPDAAAREQIWRKEFPTATPLGEIDFPALARLNLSGGSIHSAVLNAAFRGADGPGKVDHTLLADAARVELAKFERSLQLASSTQEAM